MIDESHKWSFAQEDKVKITLGDDYKATAQTSSGTVNGRWSTIYDQAIKVELDNGQRFLANFRYNVNTDITKDVQRDAAVLAESDIHTNDYTSFDSDCKQTMVGFVQTSGDGSTMTSHNVQCFYGKQDKLYDFENALQTETGPYKFA